MSDLNSQEYEAAPVESAPAGVISVVMSWMGAMTSIALVGGLVYWGYQLAVRDVSEVPVIRALEGPMRIAPDDPGGAQAAHQGLSVNTVQSDGSVEDAAERITLAPDPVTLTDQDIVVAAVEAPAEDAEVGNLADLSAVTPLDDETAVATELAGVSISDEVAAAMIEATQDGISLEDLPGVKISHRPIPRPAVKEAALALQPETELVTRDANFVLDADPAVVEAGTRLVQLGAFDDRESAMREWDFIVEKHTDYLYGKQRLIQQAESGGRSFYRLRVVGFEDLADSRRMCSALLALGTPCIPVTAR